jgi:hypothetical protein
VKKGWWNFSGRVESKCRHLAAREALQTPGSKRGIPWDETWLSVTHVTGAQGEERAD